MIVVVMILSITGCGSSNISTPSDNQKTSENESVNSNNGDVADDEKETEVENEETSASDNEDVKEDKPSDKGEVDDYYVKIKKATYTKDIEGKKTIVVHLDFTNNGKKAESAIFAINVTAYQDGVELEKAIVINSSKFNGEIRSKKAKSGKTIKDCQYPFVLDGKKPVEVEVTGMYTTGEANVSKRFKVK